MRKITILLAFLFMLGVDYANAQTRTISGKVTNSEDGGGIPGVTVLVKGTQVGTITDLEGSYTLNVTPDHTTLVFQFVGMKTVEVAIGDQNTINVTMEQDVLMMDEVVVTALGISREKKSLGYAVQEVSGEDVSAVKRDNFINSLSGRAAGVQVRSTNNIGGSSNVIIRGNSSLTQSNQALFVVDGVPVNNSNTNNAGQITGRNGYDYGNASSDINPNDIESISILKGLLQPLCMVHAPPMV
jgi:outer membrane receptor protein involved in Fe transport